MAGEEAAPAQKEQAEAAPARKEDAAGEDEAMPAAAAPSAEGAADLSAEEAAPAQKEQPSAAPAGKEDAAGKDEACGRRSFRGGRRGCRGATCREGRGPAVSRAAHSAAQGGPARCAAHHLPRVGDEGSYHCRFYQLAADNLPISHPLADNTTLPPRPDRSRRAASASKRGSTSSARPPSGARKLLNPTPHPLNPAPETRNPKTKTLHPTPQTLTLNPKPETRKPKPHTRNPNPQTRSPKAGTH